MLTLIHTGLLLDSDAEPTSPSLVIRQQWITIAAGCAAAALVAWLLAPIALLLQPSPFVIVVASCLFIAMSSAAGFLGVWIAEHTIQEALPFDARQIYRQSLAAWMFFPCIALLCQRRSVLVLLPAIIASFVATIRLRGLFAGDAAPHASTRKQPTRPLNGFYGLPASDSNPELAVVIAICAIGALLCLSNHLLFSGLLLLAASLSLPLWQWSTFAPKAVSRFSGTRSLSLAAALSVLLTILAIAPTSFADGFWPFTGPSHHSLFAAHAQGKLKGVQRDYVSIILLPPPAKKTRIIPPPPSGAGTAATKSVVIPFDGSYWYFQPPAVGPGTQAHQVHGTPTATDIRSTSVHPLAMEAHQRLDVPIDLACCRAIDLTITNADARPGPIALRITLQDSSARQTFDLGKMTVRSSSVNSIHLNRQPVRETLRFYIPPSKTISRFDRITVIYLPDAARSRVGAKVSIDSFTLVPK